jgi:photosystem I subunit III
VQIPTLGFLYVAGYIGHVGRSYVMAIKEEKKPQDKEIIIDVPMALRMAVTGFAWPVQVVAELRAGTLTNKPENITVSPR